ncbi:MrpH family fimbial adhesin (plasmid) [Enterobacter mori]|uniref:MrpH family fimbial adhesin n=1 Tax=Enterobacter mori TaxID=539813 RepID=UPI003F63E3FB
MKRLIFATILLSGLTFSHVTSASIWSWIDQITTNDCTSGLTYCYNYHYTISAWDDIDSTPNPCYGLTACTIFLSHRHFANGTSGNQTLYSMDAANNPELLTAETMGSLGDVVKSVISLPYSGIARHTSNDTTPTEECVGIFYASGRNLGNTTSETQNSAYGGYPILPGSICGAAPPPSGSCDFTQDSVMLDHGTLSRRELEGHEVTEQVNLTCTTSQTLKLYIYAADKVQLRDDGSLYSELYLNNTILGTEGFTIDVNENAVVDVKSTLRTNGTPESGEFSGSTIMLITVE